MFQINNKPAFLGVIFEASEKINKYSFMTNSIIWAENKYIKIYAILQRDDALVAKLSLGATTFDFNNCVVEKDLNLSGCTGLTQLPHNLSVSGTLELRGCTGLTRLPDNLSVCVGLDLTGCNKLTRLPDNLSVGRYLDLAGCSKLTQLPKKLSVGGYLDLAGCTGLTQLPKNMKIGDKIYSFAGNKANYPQYEFD